MTRTNLLKYIQKHSADDWLEKHYGGYFMLIFIQSYYSVISAAGNSPLAMPHGLTFQDISGHHEFSHFWNVNEMKAVREKIYTGLTKNNNFGRDFYKDYLAGWNEFIKVAEKKEKADPSSLEPTEIVRYMTDIFTAGAKQSHGYVVDCFLSFADDDWFKEFIVERLDFKLSDKEIDILREPTHRTFVNEAEMRVIEAACQIEKGESVDNTAAGIAADYFWIESNYLQGKPRTIKDFQQKIAATENACEKYKTKKGRIDRVKKAKKKLYDQINASDLLKSFVQMADDFTQIQDCRKQQVLRFNNHYFRYIDTLAEKTKTDREDLLYLLPFELKKFLREPAELIKKARQRQKGCIVVFDSKEFAIFSGQELEKIKVTDFIKDYSGVIEAKGSPASLGKATGVARVIIGSEQFANFSEGEILITNQTTPDFVPLMKKAVAVVAEQGGATSHAAIVSRELGVPCIVGVKDAMRIFNDGDQVEVDASKGVVRKLI